MTLCLFGGDPRLQCGRDDRRGRSTRSSARQFRPRRSSSSTTVRPTEPPRSSRHGGADRPHPPGESRARGGDNGRVQPGRRRRLLQRSTRTISGCPRRSSARPRSSSRIRTSPASSPLARLFPDGETPDPDGRGRGPPPVDAHDVAVPHRRRPRGRRFHRPARAARRSHRLVGAQPRSRPPACDGGGGARDAPHPAGQPFLRPSMRSATAAISSRSEGRLSAKKRRRRQRRNAARRR